MRTFGRSSASAAMSSNVRCRRAWSTTPTLSSPCSRSSRYIRSVSSVVDESSMSIRTKLSTSAARRTTASMFLRGEVVPELEAERGRLDADVRVEAPLRDRVDGVEVRAGDRLRLLRRDDLLTEDVDRGRLPLGVQPCRRSRQRPRASRPRCSGRRSAGRPSSERPGAGGRARGRGWPSARIVEPGDPSDE